MRYPDLEDSLVELESMRKSIARAVYGETDRIQFNSNGVFLAGAVASRMNACVDAFCTLIRAGNDYIAPAVIRMALENVLTFEAARIHDSGMGGLANHLLKGGRIRDIASFSKLARNFDEREGIQNTYRAYEIYSSSVHFDEKSMHSILTLMDNGEFTIKIPMDGPFSIPNVQREDIWNWIVSMATCCRLTIALLEVSRSEWLVPISPDEQG